MANTSQEQQYVVSPLDEPVDGTSQYSDERGSMRLNGSDDSRRSNEKLGHSVSESTLVSKTWQPPSTRKGNGIGRWWPWEWLCELLAVASLGAMVLVLLQYNNKPQADWQIPYFTLNGLIAFLATLTKTGIIIPVSAAIGQRKWLRFLPNGKGNRSARRLGDFETFDEASRGSLGSAKLIFSLNAWDIACLGALITIVSVFFSAITQNVLGTYNSIQNGSIVDLHAGRVPRSELFNETTQPRDTSVNLRAIFRNDVSTIAAIYSGIMSDSVPDLPISCATGDCTWPIIPTLGMCGACMDMKRYLEIIPCTGSSKGNCNFSIPGGLTLSKPRTLLEWNDTTPVFTAGPGSGLIFNQTDVVGEEPIYEGISFDFIGQSYSEFMEANRGTYSPGNETLFTEGNVLAYECGLWYCLQARSVNASNGIVKDSVINHRNWVALGTWTNRTQPKYSFQNDPSFDANDTNVNDYSGSMSELTHTLRGALSGSITISANWDVDYDWGELPWDRKYGYYNGFGPAADCLHAAWKYADDIDGWWERLAKSMTNNIRLNGYLRVDENDSFGTKDDGRYDGIAWTSVVHVEVRWLWLIFPAALVLSSTTFLVATMVASQQSNLRPWKSFILPVLYTRLEDGLQDEWTQEYAHDDTLLSEVTNRWVGLDNCEDSWVFRHVTKELKKMHQIRFAGDTSVDG